MQHFRIILNWTHDSGKWKYTTAQKQLFETLLFIGLNFTPRFLAAAVGWSLKSKTRLNSSNSLPARFVIASKSGSANISMKYTTGEKHVIQSQKLGV